MHDPTNSRYRYLQFTSADHYRRFKSGDDNSGIEQPDVIDAERPTPAHGSYAAALFRPEWKLKREQIIRRDRNSCVVCSNTEALQVHHRQYHFLVSENKFRLPWEYDDHLMVTLCESCHKRGHAKFKVPIINL